MPRFYNTSIITIPADTPIGPNALCDGDSLTATIGTSRSEDYGVALTFDRADDAVAFANAILAAALKAGA